jgi:hypothetical protein
MALEGYAMSVFTNPASATPEETARYVSALLGLIADNDPVQVLRQTPEAVARLVDAVPATILTTPEAAGKWSMREVIAHLADSELVGGFRLRMVLAHDRPQIIGYDQDRWSERLRYHEVDVRDALEQFTVLRRRNLRLWQDLGPQDLARVGVHSERGEESLEHIRRLYAAHDLLHLRQLERIRQALSSR